MANVLACETVPTDDYPDGCPSGWYYFDVDSPTALVTILESIGEFDLITVSSLIAAYLVFLIMGYSAGVVVRQMRRL